MNHPTIKRYVFSLFFILGISLGLLILPPLKVLAASPGCYVKTSGSMETKKSECPPAEAAGVAEGKCFFRQVVPKAPVAYVERPCEEITLSNENDSTSPGFVESDCQEVDVTKENCGIIRYLVIFIDLLSAAVGIVVVISIILGGIQYTSSGGDPQKVSAAKSRILNSIIAFFIFIFMYAFLQYIIPGGLL